VLITLLERAVIQHNQHLIQRQMWRNAANEKCLENLVGESQENIKFIRHGNAWKECYWGVLRSKRME